MASRTRQAGSAIGLQRVSAPSGVLPQRADRLDPTPVVGPDEVLIDVECLNLDAASYRQLREAHGSGDAVRKAVLEIVAERGKMQNPVTGSGGMLLGTVREVGPESPLGLQPGQRVATLVSLTLTPLRITDGLERWDGLGEQVPCTGTAILFGRSIAAVLPADLPESLALSVLDVCGAPALTDRVVRRKGTTPGVCVLGGGGKSGSLSLAAARRAGAGRLVALVPTEKEAVAVREAGIADEVVLADARDPVAVAAAVGEPVDVTVVCVDVPGCEHGAILATADGGTVVFFSMATSFAAAALGAEGLAADVEMLIGNGYVPGHAEFALDLVRTEPGVRALFEGRDGAHSVTMSSMLLVGGWIYAQGIPDATAMAVTGDTITWVGQDGPGRALYPDAEVVDLRGAFCAPAFVDAHVHATATGLQLTGLDLTGTRSLAECLAALRAEVEARPGAVWGHGWDETLWPEGRAPSRAEIDAIAGDVPVYLSRVDVHSAVVSTALADLAPRARTSAGWSPDGPVTADAHHHTRGAARAALDPRRRQAAQRAYLRHAAAQGVAAVHECAGPDISGVEDLTDLLAMAASPELPDVTGYWGERADPSLAQRLGVAGLAGDLFADGAVGSRTAALSSAYADDPGNTGNRYLDAAAIAEHLIACTRAGIQAGFHVIGDAGVTAVVDGFTQAEHVLGVAALAARRHRLEHLEMVTPDQAKQLGVWGVVGSVQPAFDAAWGGPDGMYARRLGVPRGTELNPFSALAAAGVTLAFGSDSPVTHTDPWGTVRAAVHHRTPGFGISPRAAFTAHTRAGWRAAGHADSLIGTLQPGAPATYAIWEAGELVTAPPDSRVQRWSTDPRAGIPALPALDPGADLPVCLRTVLRGNVIHDREGALG